MRNTNRLPLIVLLGLSGAASAQTLPVPVPDALSAGWKGQPTCKMLHEDASMRFIQCDFPPGAGHEKHFHPAHYNYVLRGGKARVTTAAGTRDTELVSGSVRMNPAIEWHEVVNLGDAPLSFLIVEPRVR